MNSETFIRLVFETFLGNTRNNPQINLISQPNLLRLMTFQAPLDEN